MPPPSPALLHHLAALRHDLGKYVAMQTRSLGEAPEPERLREALLADLLHTRRGPDGSRDAVWIYGELGPALRGERPLSDGQRVDLRGDPDFDAIEQAMARIASSIDALRRGDDSPEGLRAAASDALDVSARCRALHNRHRAAGGPDV